MLSALNIEDFHIKIKKLALFIMPCVLLISGCVSTTDNALIDKPYENISYDGLVNASLQFCHNPINDSAKYSMFRSESTAEELEEYHTWKKVNKSKSKALIEKKIRSLQNKLVEDYDVIPDMLFKITSTAYLEPTYNPQLKGYVIGIQHLEIKTFSLKVTGERSTLGKSLRATVFSGLSSTFDGLDYENEISFEQINFLSDIENLEYISSRNGKLIYPISDETDAYNFTKKITQNGRALNQTYLVKPTGCIYGRITGELVGFHLSFAETDEHIASWGVKL